MAKCEVKRTATITLVLEEREAQFLRTLLGGLRGAHRNGVAVLKALRDAGIDDHSDRTEYSPGTWAEPVPM